VLQKLLFQILAAILALWLAQRFVPKVSFEGATEIFLFCGLTLGLSNFFIKPILRKITLPLRFLTLGIFDFFINMGIVWFIDILFPELKIVGILPLFLTTCIVWVLNFFLGQ